MNNNISAHKTVLGTAASLFMIGIVAPAAFWLVSAGIDGAFGLSRLVGVPWSSIVGAAGILIGVFWILWAWSYLLFVGRGLPLEVFGRALHPTKVLVTTGPYAYTRNPMVLGLLFVLLGLAFLRGSLSGFIIVPVIGLGAWLYLAEFEERGLVARFGAEYEKYRQGVPTVFPRLSAYVHAP
jgi:protein-S-isoprenylcysteine O-methyltransferase Ste14